MLPQMTPIIQHLDSLRSILRSIWLRHYRLDRQKLVASGRQIRLSCFTIVYKSGLEGWFSNQSGLEPNALALGSIRLGNKYSDSGGGKLYPTVMLAIQIIFERFEA